MFDGYNTFMKIIAIIFLFLFFNVAIASEFGEYQYGKYLGIQQQLQTQRNIALRRARLQNQNPTRNIRYPSANNPYPNIQKTTYRRSLTPQQRYSARYYNTL